MNGKNNSETLDDTLRVRIPSTLKDKLISESANLNIDLSELVRQFLTQFIINRENRTGLPMCDSNIYETYKLTSKIPTKDLTYDQILFLTAHNHCCGKQQINEKTKGSKI